MLMEIMRRCRGNPEERARRGAGLERRTRPACRGSTPAAGPPVRRRSPRAHARYTSAAARMDSGESRHIPRRYTWCGRCDRHWRRGGGGEPAVLAAPPGRRGPDVVVRADQRREGIAVPGDLVDVSQFLEVYAHPAAGGRSRGAALVRSVLVLAVARCRGAPGAPRAGPRYDEVARCTRRILSMPSRPPSVSPPSACAMRCRTEPVSSGYGPGDAGLGRVLPPAGLAPAPTTYGS